MKGTTSTAQT